LIEPTDSEPARASNGPFDYRSPFLRDIRSYYFRLCIRALRFLYIGQVADIVRAPFFSTVGILRVDTSQIVTIVDDDEAVRLATASLIRALGWKVRTFGSAEEFLQSGHVDDTSCVISDVRMPGISGVAMQVHLLGLGIALPTIFVTAFPNPALQAEVMANGALVLLEKPVAAKDIVHWLGLALARRSTGHNSS
jgi:CheY-like chemotaxis protein